ncbi:MAG: tetratricopeptide repeat-containing glycosyltransferase family protein [Rhizomicrobium sp.]
MTLQAQYDQAVAAHRRGEFEEAERLYRRLLEAAPSSATARHMLGVLRAQSGDTTEALDLIGAALTLKPDASDILFNYARVLKGVGRLDEALTAYDRALTVKPDYAAARDARAEALNLKGNSLREAGQAAQALSFYDRALTDAPRYPDALNNRAVALWSLGRFDEALAGSDAALALKPDYVEAHYNRGNVLRDLLRLEEAKQSFDRAIVLDPAFAPAHRNKAFCALLQGDFAQGLPLYEWRKRLNPPIEARSYPQPLWTGAEDLKAKTVFVYIEQGLGDTIQFYRFVTPLLARGARVILSVQDSLLRLLEHARPRVELIGSRTVPPAFDYHIPLMSLPLALELTPGSIPDPGRTLEPDALKTEEWAARIGKKGFKIGISWQGARGGVTSRAMPLDCFQGLSRIPGVRLISLQKDFGAEQRAGRLWVEGLEGLDDGADAFVDTAAVIANLDLVITLDSAVAHLAGALRCPVWVALKQVPDWRWFLGRDDSPWYSSMRLFRQTKDGDWDGVFAEMESQVPQ